MNINLGRKLILILATSTGLALTGCAASEQHTPMYEPSLTDICLEDNNESNVDEVMSLEATVKIGIPKKEYGTEKVVEKDLIESLDKLELYTKRLIKLKEAGIKVDEESKGLLKSSQKELQSEELSEEKKEKLISMSLEELEELLTLYEQHKQKDVERARTEQELKFLFTNDQRWLQENGGYLLVSGLNRILKAHICTVSGLEPENYQDCVLVENENEYKRKFIVEVTDKKTGKVFKYKITKDSGIYYDVIQWIDAIKFSYVSTTQTLAEVSNLMKECAVTPPTINEDRIIVPTITKEDAIQKVKSHN